MNKEGFVGACLPQHSTIIFMYNYFMDILWFSSLFRYGTYNNRFLIKKIIIVMSI